MQELVPTIPHSRRSLGKGGGWVQAIETLQKYSVNGCFVCVIEEAEQNVWTCSLLNLSMKFPYPCGKFFPSEINRKQQKRIIAAFFFEAVEKRKKIHENVIVSQVMGV